MKPPSPTTLLSLLVLSPTIALAVATGPVSHSHSSPAPPSTWSTAFPHLRRLRDTAVELLFGSSSAPKPSSLSSTTWASVQSRFANQAVVRFNVSSREEERALREATDRLFLDIWALTPEYVDVRVRKAELKAALSLLPESLGRPFVVVEDVAKLVWGTYPQGKRWGEGRVGGRERGGIEEWEERVGRGLVAGGTRDGVDNMFFRDYQPLSVIASWLRLLEAMFPSYVELISIGTSYEGRDIHAIRMGARDQDGDSSKSEKRKTILITGGIHAREWISTSSVNYLIWSLTTAYGKEPLITKLLQDFDVVLVPVVNPDGYEYTWSADRLWRKSRQQTGLRICRGLDLDHAFGYAWDAVRHQADPCSESYGGDKPFQAVEAAKLADWAQNETDRHGVKFVGLLDLHSYSQQILFPYSYSCAVDPPNRENLEELAVGLAKAIRLSSGEVYGVESACEGAVLRNGGGDEVPRVEAGGGSFIDWFYHEMGAHFSYQVKLRDTGSYGFLLPPENIVPTGEEMYAAMKYFADYLLGNNGRETAASNEESHPKDSQGTGERWTELRRRVQR